MEGGGVEGLMEAEKSRQTEEVKKKNTGFHAMGSKKLFLAIS